jgi:Glycosyl transferase family 2
MTVTVGIATTGDNPQLLTRAVDSVLASAAQLPGDPEVLVVVNGRDRLPELERVGSPALRVVYRGQRNVAGARNTVLAQARHDTILFSDDLEVVPPQWCPVMVNALREPGCAVVQGPVDIEVQGPVSAFLNYQRLYDATPAGPDEVSMVAAGNCGLRRDLLPPFAYDVRLTDSGEDSEFGLTVRDAGYRIRWLPEARVSHAMSDRIEEIAGRLMRYGRGGAGLSLHCGRSEADRPGALELYQDMTREGYPLYRRFGEIVVPEVRHAFVGYDYIGLAASLIGYLDAVGRIVGEPVVDLDADRLMAAWRELAARLGESVAGLSEEDWRHLPVDYTRLGAHDEELLLLTEIREVLRRHARPIPGRPTGPAAEVLVPPSEELLARCMRDIDRGGRIWTELNSGGQPVTVAAFDHAVRAAAMSFWTAGQLIELKIIFDRGDFPVHSWAWHVNRMRTARALAGHR